MGRILLNELIDTFQKHAIEYDQSCKKWIQDHPDDESATFDFNICEALYSICCEIDELKNGQNNG